MACDVLTLSRFSSCGVARGELQKLLEQRLLDCAGAFERLGLLGCIGEVDVLEGVIADCSFPFFGRLFKRLDVDDMMIGALGDALVTVLPLKYRSGITSTEQGQIVGTAIEGLSGPVSKQRVYVAPSHFLWEVGRCSEKLVSSAATSAFRVLESSILSEGVLLKESKI